MSAASQLKEAGNAKFKAGAFAEAAELYAAAIAADPDDAALHSNRCAALLRLEGRAGEAAEAAQACIALRPSWDKGHYRLGCALEKGGDAGGALAAFEAAVEANPFNEEGLTKIKALKKALGPEGLEGLRYQAQAAAERAAERARDPSAWAATLPDAQKQQEFFIDAYRMRVDDEYAWGGGETRGLYGADGDPEFVALDFLAFCKLAAARRAVPAGWDWAGVCAQAASLLPYAFEKSDAQEKWGGENVFAAAMGGRSLRATAEAVLGSSCTSQDDPSDEEFELMEQLQEAGWERLVRDGRGAGAGGGVFGAVGGVAAWRELMAGLAKAMG
jgi:hypothetical protein